MTETPAGRPQGQADSPVDSPVESRPARLDFRVLTQTRGGYDDGVMYDVQLQSTSTGNLAWAQTFTDPEQAEEFKVQVQDDLELDTAEFRRRYSVSSNA